MGSTYEVKFVGDVPLPDVQHAVDEVLAEFDAIFSQWREDSEIVRLNRDAEAAPFALSPRFFAVLEAAVGIARRTEGAFDPTVGPLLALYREARADPEARLDAAAMTAARARVGHQLLATPHGEVERDVTGMQFDLDGIVAGACIDAIASRLDGLGVAAFYLEVTGEVFCRGEKAPGVPWRIGVVDPRADLLGGEAAITAVALRDRALCTSGDYRNALTDADGRRLHHVFDPRTGANAGHDVVSASVWASSAALADALATAFLVLGEDGTRRVLPQLADLGEVGVLLLLADDEHGLRAVKLNWPKESK